MDLVLTIVGLCVGFLVGLTGVGGAALLTPILIMLGIQPIIAVGTDLVYNSITKIFGTLQHWRQKTVHARIAGYFAVGSIPSAILAVNLIQWFEIYFGSADIIVKKLLGFALILIPISLLLKNVIRKRNPAPVQWNDAELKKKRKGIVMIGAGLGFIVGLTSIGSGSLFALALMHYLQLNGKYVVGTDIAHAFLLTTAAGLAHMSFGTVDFSIVFQLLLGSIPGVIVGSVLSTKIPTVFLRYAISVIIVVTGLKLI
jgi:uncharacterized membrane protein YfcA